MKRRLWVALVVGLLSLACGKKDEGKKDDKDGKKGTEEIEARENRAVESMGQFAQDICDCKDMPCVEKAQKDFAEKWKTEEPPTLSEEQAKKVADYSDKMTKCIEAIAGAAAPTEPPPPG